MSMAVRLAAAARMAAFHFLGSVLIAALVGAMVFLAWYPHPYGLLSGGRELFLILVAVDVICGPLLTLVLFNPRKPRHENVSDMAIVIAIQLSALAYGVHIAHQARPLFLAHEVDRFRVIAMADFLGEVGSADLKSLDAVLQPRRFGGPVTVGIRDFVHQDERQKVMLASLSGGRDLAQRPEFYTAYDAAYAPKVMARAQPLQAFIQHHPELANAAQKLMEKQQMAMDDALFLPVVHKQDWVAILDRSANILGFLPGDGFAVAGAAQ